MRVERWQSSRREIFAKVQLQDILHKCDFLSSRCLVRKLLELRVKCINQLIVLGSKVCIHHGRLWVIL